MLSSFQLEVSIALLTRCDLIKSPWRSPTAIGIITLKTIASLFILAGQTLIQITQKLIWKNSQLFWHFEHGQQHVMQLFLLWQLLTVFINFTGALKKIRSWRNTGYCQLALCFLGGLLCQTEKLYENFVHVTL